MMELKDKIDEIMEKDVSRKKFIAMAGAFLLAIPFLSRTILAQVFFRDESGSMYSLSQETPSFLKLTASTQSEGNLNLSDSTNWNVDKAIIKTINITTSSTDYDIYLYSKDDFSTGEFQILYNGSGNESILLDYPYEDADGTKEIHLTYTDNSGSNTADIDIRGVRLK